MQMCYETERLYLKILGESAVSQVLDFYARSRDTFECWEPDRPESFYSPQQQRALLNCEFQLAMKQSSIRFWLLPKEAPNQIIGTFSYQEITRTVYQSCQVGYKLDPAFWHAGYASEALRATSSIMFDELNLHRIEALVLPENIPSIRLLERCGFVNEGISRSCIFLHGSWCDHFRFSRIRP